MEANAGFYYFLNKIKNHINLSEIKSIYDIGSRDCIEALYFHKEFPNTKITAFEPNDEQYQICLNAVQGKENIKVVNKALSNFIGTASFYKTPGNIGASSLLKPSFVPWTPNQQIVQSIAEVTTLDKYIKDNNDFVNLIWMDVQGNELYTLQGGKESLKEVKAIYCEAGVIPYYENHSLKADIISFLENQNFILIDDKLDWTHETNLIFVKK